MQKSVQMRSGSHVRLLTAKQSAARNSSIWRLITRERDRKPQERAFKQRQRTVVRVSKHVLVPEGRQAWTRCITNLMGTCIIEPNVDHFRKHCLSTPNRTVDIESERHIPCHSGNGKCWAFIHTSTERDSTCTCKSS